MRGKAGRFQNLVTDALGGRGLGSPAFRIWKKRAKVDVVGDEGSLEQLCYGNVHELARPAIRKYHTLEGLNFNNLFSYRSGGWKSRRKSGGLVSPEASFSWPADSHLPPGSLVVFLCTCLCSNLLFL